MVNEKIQRFRIMYFVYGLILAISATGCMKEQETIILRTTTPEIIIPFKTIENFENGYRGDDYRELEPKLVIITDLDDIDKLGGSVFETAESLLRKLDFSQSLALVVFQGGKGSGGYKVDILKIVQEGNKLIVYAHFTEPQPGYVVTMANTSPYHVIEVPKNGLQGEISFLLNVDGEVIIQQPKIIP